MTRFFGCLFLVLCIAACGASPRRAGWGAPPPERQQGFSAVRATPGAGVTQTGGQTTQAASGDARAILGQFDVYMRQRGFQPVGPAIHNSNLAESGLIAYAVAAQQGACYAFVAIGERPNQDINIVVTDPGARQIGFDVRPDNHPWAVACPGVAGRVSTRVQMQSGSGGFYYTVYQGPSAQQVNLSEFFGGPSQTVQTATIDTTTSGRVDELGTRLSGQGFRRVVDPIGFVMQDRQERMLPLNLDSRYCYSFATFGGPGARDTDVYLMDGGNNELATDHGTGLDSAVEYCPQQTGSYQLKVTMYAGSGPLFMAGFARAAQAATPTPTPASTPVVSGEATAGAGLEDNFRLLDSDMRARGYETFGEQTRGELASGTERSLSIALEGGKCYAILAVGDNGVRDLDLILSDSRDREVDRDVEENPRPIVRVCPTSSGTYTMHLRMFNGQGHFVYSAYRWPRGTRGPFGLRGLMYVRLAEMTQLLSADQYTPDADFTPAQGTFRAQGETHSHELQLAANRCYSVLVVGGEGLDDVDARLMQGNTQLATDASRNAFPNVRYCTTQAGTYSLGVRAAAGEGAYFYQLFTHPSE
ncbi:MAG: hypothetical protein IPK60_15775 [Sandaracinaceae bacterium]|nr:hypothetical protein [Sandaracinaceae bacterium]